MQPLNCIIIDDEPLSRKGLKEYINDIDFLNLVGEYDNPLKATTGFKDRNVHLLFLDIQMPKISGIEFFKSLHHAPPVIFTTAFPQYALDGFLTDELLEQTDKDHQESDDHKKAQDSRTINQMQIRIMRRDPPLPFPLGICPAKNLNGL